MSTLGAIGECMLEFRQNGDAYSLGYGGDVFNTAVYAKRSGADVTFFSATGDDHHSDYLMRAWRAEGVATETVRIIPDSTPSLYIIETDKSGERSFHYWREASPFKQWLTVGAYPNTLPAMLQTCACLYFSGITLAILPDTDKTKILELMRNYRRGGGTVAFDSNYRPKLWGSGEQATYWMNLAYGVSDIALPSFEDEVLLRGDQSPESVIQLIQELGANEVVLKNGSAGVTIKTPESTEHFLAETIETVVDTTAAGDAFNGAYLAARLKGEDVAPCARAACKAAAKVIQHRGAIIPRDVSLQS